MDHSDQHTHVDQFRTLPDSARQENARQGSGEQGHHDPEQIIVAVKADPHVEEKYAHRYYNEVALGVDFTARDLQAEQKKKGLPWEIAKGFDYSAPISEFYPLEKYGDIHELSFRLDVNGKTVQDGNTTLMIFSFEKIIAYVSRFMTLKTGDLIYTGTPAGVGPVAINDRLEAYLEGDKLMDFPVK